MIFGIGVDVASIERIERVWRRTGVRFAEHMLAEAEGVELAGVTDVPRWLAKRWAAKEAFGKAAGTGIRAPLRLRGIEIAHDSLGRPLLRFEPAIDAWLAERGVERCHLSISDEREVVCAMVVLESSGVRPSGE